MNRKAHGFTIVELLIVIVVIAILAAISVAAYTSVQERAKTSRRNSEMAQLLKAITLARTATGKTLGEITGSYASISACVNTGPNPDGLESKDLLKTSSCWARYYINLDKISAASGVDLSSFRDGDARGNPYMWDENEGEGGNYCSTDGQIRYFNGNGVDNIAGLAIPSFIQPASLFLPVLKQRRYATGDLSKHAAFSCELLAKFFTGMRRRNNLAPIWLWPSGLIC